MNSNTKLLVYLVRHGESSGNITQTLLNEYNDQLTENGKIQADLLGKHFSNIRFDRVYSSAYSRALDTAQIIVRSTKSPNINIQVDERLNEIDYGILVGKSYKDGFAFVKSLNLPILDWSFPEGESFREAGERISRFWKDICVNRMDEGSPAAENVLVVTHSVAMTNFLASLPTTEGYSLQNWSPESDLKVMKNTSYMEIAVTPKEEGGLEMNFLLKHFSKHLNLDITENGGIKSFVKKEETAKEFSGCIQQ